MPTASVVARLDARARARAVVGRRRLPRGSRPLRVRPLPRPRAREARLGAVGPLGRGRGDRRAARAVRRVGRARERVPPRRATRAVSYPCRLQPDLHIVDDPAAAVGELLAEQARARRLDRPHRRLDARPPPTGAPPSSSPTGAASRSGGATSAACRPTTSARTTASRRRRCSTGSTYRRATIHRIRGEAPPAEAADELDAALAGRDARLPAARPRPRRAHGVALPRLAAARRHRPARDRRPGRARAVGPPRHDDGADDPVGQAHRLPRQPARRRPMRSRAASAVISPRTCPPAWPGWPRCRSRSSSTRAAGDKLDGR